MCNGPSHMRTIGIIGVALFYLFLNTGSWECLLHCTERSLLTTSMPSCHKSMGAVEQAAMPAAGDERPGRPCCDKGPKYLVQENLPLNGQHQLTIPWFVAAPPHAHGSVPTLPVLTGALRLPALNAPPGLSGRMRSILHGVLLI